MCDKIENYLDAKNFLRLGEVEMYSKKYNSTYIGSLYIFKNIKYRVFMSSIATDDCKKPQQLTFMLSSSDFDSVYEALSNTRFSIKKYLNSYGTHEVSEDEFYDHLNYELED